MNEVDIIKGAREYLSDPAHWHQGNLGNGLGGRCLVYALCNAAIPVGTEYSTPLAQRAIDLVRAQVPGQFKGRASSYNDAESTTHQDILDLLDKTLADLGALV